MKKRIGYLDMAKGLAIILVIIGHSSFVPLRAKILLYVFHIPLFFFLSVFESHEIADQVESMLSERFGVFDTDIHIEPAPIPEDEILDNVYKKLLMREQLIDQGNQLEELLAEDFVYIRQDGQELDKGAYKAEKELTSAIKELHLTSISQKTKLIRYQVGDTIHTSIWRRHETWQNIFHQETKIEKD